ncbi:hypothetical protein LSH36_826g02044 [Paralvinella palmiformis]|uniref:Apple domain-containing protein n=1 Tax=Paralvinella palmiformis TaxID=53620 RepID=A0AAD9IZT7_9ANNE|nr:hypothetical protein LSH36_826g02044 [Paralvinella palmiformis]
MFRSDKTTMSGRWLLQILILSLLVWMTSCVDQKSSRVTIQYKDLEGSPSISFRIKDIANVSLPTVCLIQCSRNDLCKSIVHEGTSCSLYNTTEIATALQHGQTAISELTRETN